MAKGEDGRGCARRGAAAGAGAAGASAAGPPRGAAGADLALYHALLDSDAAGDGEGLRIVGPQFGDDDGTGGRVRLLRLSQSVMYSLLIRKRYPAGARAQGA